MLEESLADLRKCLASVFENRMPEATFDWEISDRAISEIGGRLIEDFVLRGIAEAAAALVDRNSDCIVTTVPTTGRTIEDFRFTCHAATSTVELLVDIKGHNQQRAGSRPNLASIRKCIELYADPILLNQEIVMFLCRYEPRVRRNAGRTHLVYEVLPQSFNERHVVPIRWLGRGNLDPANIGSGGQILLAREDSITIERRSREEFVSVLRSLEQRLRDHPARLTP